jgi:small subunit ribosomal protein S6
MTRLPEREFPMPVNVYECLYLLDATKVAGNIEAAKTSLHTTLEKHKAEILASRPWDERKLAYPVKNQKKGLYYLIYFKADSQALIGMEQDYALNETILRMLVLNIEPKWVDPMLAVAKDEHALALQTAIDDSSSDMGGGGGFRGERGERGERGDRGGDEGEAVGAGGPPRRGGRRPAEGDDR